jgi:hypothetical protein
MLIRRFCPAVCVAALLGSCSAPPSAAPKSAAWPREPSRLGKRRADLPDDCAQQPGKPAPEPLLKPYAGVANSARCQREVYTIMGGVTHFLGVQCNYCHVEPDYAADTHRKQIANWMARELIPRLEKRAGEGGAPWCNDCHQGKPKLLGDPRRPELAIEWMTTHLVEDFDAQQGKSLRCRNCHRGDLGSPEFQGKLILAELPGLSAKAPDVTPEPTAVPTSTQTPRPTQTPTPSPTPPTSPAPAKTLPDFGAR